MRTGRESAGIALPVVLPLRAAKPRVVGIRPRHPSPRARPGVRALRDRHVRGRLRRHPPLVGRPDRRRRPLQLPGARRHPSPRQSRTGPACAAVRLWHCSALRRRVRAGSSAPGAETRHPQLHSFDELSRFGSNPDATGWWQGIASTSPTISAPLTHGRSRSRFMLRRLQRSPP